jgi:hypothetical protein
MLMTPSCYGCMLVVMVCEFLASRREFSVRHHLVHGSGFRLTTGRPTEFLDSRLEHDKQKSRLCSTFLCLPCHVPAQDQIEFAHMIGCGTLNPEPRIKTHTHNLILRLSNVTAPSYALSRHAMHCSSSDPLSGSSLCFHCPIFRVGAARATSVESPSVFLLQRTRVPAPSRACSPLSWRGHHRESFLVQDLRCPNCHRRLPLGLDHHLHHRCGS